MTHDAMWFSTAMREYGMEAANRLARMMGGSIQVSSQLGSGSRFTLRVPLGEGADLTPVSYGPDDLTLRDNYDDTAHPDDFHGRVLLVEDVKVNRALIAAMLRLTTMCFQVVIA